MDKPTVIVTRGLPDGWLSAIEERCELHLGSADRPGLEPELEAKLAECDGIFCMLTETIDDALLARAPRLRVVSNLAVGVDNVDLAACTQRGIPVGNTPGVLTEATADLTMALMLAAARRLPESSEDARAGRWTTWSPTGWLGIDLAGATLGIVGMGKIGQAVATRARGFGMEILYADPTPPAGALGRHVELAELLRESDVVVIHVSLNESTHGLIGRDELQAMKPTALLINSARGPIVDSAALREALMSGEIAGAALDVTDPEPLPPDDPLFALPNLLITPHIGSATWGTRRRMAELACDNLVAGLEGRPLPHCANPEVYGKRS